MEMGNYCVTFPFPSRVFGGIYISLVRLVVRGEICIETSVAVAQGCSPLASAIDCAFLETVARSFFDAVEDLADNLPVHKVF